MPTPPPRPLSIAERVDDALFNALTSRNLIYNTCWEDPAIDRRALTLSGSDTVLAIASAGCNVLDYLLDGPRRLIAVDVNPHQTALLELKVAALRRLEYRDVFALFGRGSHPHHDALYRTALRPLLSAPARELWDRQIRWFAPEHGSFYRFGLSGLFARAARAWLQRDVRVDRATRELFEQPDLDAQRAHYLGRVRPLIWNRTVHWLLSRQITLSLLGVPMPQRRLVQTQHVHGVGAFMQEAIDRVFCTLPAWDNYFYRLYVFAEYDPACCPRYLAPEGVERLRADGLLDRLEIHTCSVTEYLEQTRDDAPITRAVLLDHMDWMSSYHPDALAAEWNALHRRLAPAARVLFRSSHLRPPYLDSVRVGGDRMPLHDWMRFDAPRAEALAREDRVGTYASFHIGEVRPWT